jgi:putative hemolysin
MRLMLTALAALALAACSPMTGQSPDAAAPGQSAEASCAAQGGTLQRVGRLQSVQCVIAYADAGKRCTDGDQCGGDCLLPEGTTVEAGAAAVGQCAATSNRFGCATRVEDGKADATLCID